MEDHITDDFGARTNPVTGKTEIHKGIDLGIPTGTPVTSSFDGVIQTVSYPRSSDPDSTRNAGIYIVVKGSDPEIAISTRYLHLSEAFVTPGQTVKKGEIIGLSGSTGQSTGAHLHYEMIPNGEEAIDPKPYIMMMSKLTDTASSEAFKAMKKINWTSMAPTNTYFNSMPYYESNKMLYVSNVYMETAAPAFNERGTVYIRSLFNGGSGDLGTITFDPSAPMPTPAPDDSVSVPVQVGTLKNPFFIQYAASAQKEERRSGVPASITLAQAALESGYGKRGICNNMFGIKANKGYSGPFCEALTHEEYDGIRVPIVAKFRSYSDAAGSFADHSDFLLNNKRYRVALSKKNPYEFANELQRAGYATDSQYANKLKSIIRNDNLAALDMNHGIDPATGQPFNDVSFAGGGGGGSSGGGGGSGGGSGSIPGTPNTGDTMTITFGIRQLYGQPAAESFVCGAPGGGSTTCYSPLSDPETGRTIVNLVNYSRVANLFSGRSIYPPNIAIKDVPDAISITITSQGEEELFVSNVDYIKGKY